MLLWRNLTTVAGTAVTGEYVRVAPAAGQPAHTIPLTIDAGNTGRVAISAWE